MDTHWHLLLLFAVPWVTYWDALWGAPLIDDHDPSGTGLFQYHGVLQRPLSFGSLYKHWRWLVGRVPNKAKDPPYVLSNVATHRVNLWFHGGTVCLLYLFFSQYVTTTTAFLAALLFAVHPIGTKSVAWCAGVSYVIGAFWTLTALNLVEVAHDLGWLSTPEGMVWTLLGFSALQFLAFNVQFNTVASAAVLLFLGYWPFAIVSVLMMVVVIFQTFLETVTYRKKQFNEQNMSRSIRLYPKKLFVALKTLAYYVKLTGFPKRLGLYHPFFYHYELPKTESEDVWLWAGAGVAVVAASLAVFAPPPVPLGVVWFVAFVFPFLNWITANQFISERYGWLASAGICLIVAWLLPPWAFWVVFGILLMRTWAHLPTYENDLKFYWSNVSNFPNSEVAYGNLGVCLGSPRYNMGGSALDMWRAGVRVNPDYDVNWYNLYAAYKMQGFLTSSDPNNPGAKECLVKALSSPTCHFKAMWEQELVVLNQMVAYQSRFNEIIRHHDILRADPVHAEEGIELLKAIQAIQEQNDRMKGEQQRRTQLLVEKVNHLNQARQQVGMQEQMLKKEQDLINQMTDPGVILKQQWAMIDALTVAIQQRKDVRATQRGDPQQDPGRPPAPVAPPGPAAPGLPAGSVGGVGGDTGTLGAS